VILRATFALCRSNLALDVCSHLTVRVKCAGYFRPLYAVCAGYFRPDYAQSSDCVCDMCGLLSPYVCASARYAAECGGHLAILLITICGLKVVAGSGSTTIAAAIRRRWLQSGRKGELLGTSGASAGAVWRLLHRGSCWAPAASHPQCMHGAVAAA
jgi:hypothetical protein